MHLDFDSKWPISCVRMLTVRFTRRVCFGRNAELHGVQFLRDLASDRGRHVLGQDGFALRDLCLGTLEVLRIRRQSG